MSCFEKFIEHRERKKLYNPAYESDSTLLAALPNAMLHSHAWVKSAAIRLLKTYFHFEAQGGSIELRRSDDVVSLVNALVANIQLQSQLQNVESTVVQDIFVCLTHALTVHARGIDAEQSVRIFTKLRKAALASNSDLCCLMLRWMAALVSSEKSCKAPSDTLLFHTILLCQTCMEGRSVTSSSDISSLTEPLAKQIFTSIQQALPPDVFTDLFQRVKQHSY